MGITQANAILEEFMDTLKHTGKNLLLLDYDGTLAPFTVNRQSAVPYPGVRTLLQQIIQAGKTRMIIVSGRPCAEIIELLDLNVSPEVWGAHGWQRLLPDGSRMRYRMHDAERDAIGMAYRWVAALGYAHLSERKQSGVAVHWRGLPVEDIRDIRQSLSQQKIPAICAQTMLLREFNGGMELQLKSRTKGTVIETLLSETEPQTPVAYLGDDRTDEDAFAALEFRGLRIRVANDSRESRADVMLRPPEELLDFLLHWLLACGGAK